MTATVVSREGTIETLVNGQEDFFIRKESPWGGEDLVLPAKEFKYIAGMLKKLFFEESNLASYSSVYFDGYLAVCRNQKVLLTDLIDEVLKKGLLITEKSEKIFFIQEPE